MASARSQSRESGLPDDAHVCGPSLDTGAGSAIVDSHSTGGASHGSGNPPVTFLRGDLADRLAALGVSSRNLSSFSYILESVDARTVLGYASFLSVRFGSRERLSMADVALLMDLDRDLQGSLMRAIGAIEAQVKARYCVLIVVGFGVECLYDHGNFNREAVHSRCIGAIGRELRRQARGNDSLRTWLGGGPVPCDVALGASTFGTLSKLVANTASAEVVCELAASLGTDQTSLVSWLRTLTAVRNICAHFGVLAARGQIPAVPRRIRGCSDDHTAPLYALALVDELLRGREAFLGGCEGGEACRFRADVRRAVGLVAFERPALAAVLCVPARFLPDYYIRLDDFRLATVAYRLVGLVA